MDLEKLPLLVNSRRRQAYPSRLGLILIVPFIVIAGLFTLTPLQALLDDILTLKEAKDCLDPDLGYTCLPEISRLWGQYSPYWRVPSDIPTETPDGCEVTFAQIFSRHGARNPTLKRTLRMVTTITKIQALARLEGKYSFIKHYHYDLGADHLNEFGRRELRQSGRYAKSRYGHLDQPFIRASSQQRVIDSATSFIDGYGEHLNLTIVYEGAGFNDTLKHSQCTSIESGPLHYVRKAARMAWKNTFLPPIAARLSKDLGIEITQDDAHNLMGMCPMTTIHHPRGEPTKFCQLFSLEEWQQYNQLQALEKFYGWGKGNPLGPTQGVGFVNELIARMLKQPVQDWTSVNHTMDGNPTTFPLDRNLYADFSHDDDLTSVLFAAGIYHSTPMLSITQVDSFTHFDNWSPSRTVPFAGRMYFEKMKCKSHDEELVRAVVNDRVMPLELCGSDELGRCTLSTFIKSLSFARHGGNWPMCYILSENDAKTEITLEGILQNGAGSLELLA